MHGSVSQTYVGEGRVEGMVVVEQVEFVGVEGGGVEVVWFVQGDGVEGERVEGDQGRVNSFLLGHGDGANEKK